MPTTVPPEIITDILIRLPVKYLLRFRCVSKPWCSQIDDPSFAKLHLNHSAQTNSRRSLILSHPRHYTLHSLDLDSLDRVLTLEDPPATQNLLLGSSNGLLCTCKSVEEIFFWNPVTRKQLKLPPMPLTSSKGFDPDSFDFRSMAFGFGYDSLHDDYKLVTIDRFCNTCVYSMKSNLWKRTVGFPVSVAGEQPVGVFVSGYLHWMSQSLPLVAGNTRRCMIFAIELTSDHYFPKLIQLPVSGYGAREEVDFAMGALNGSLTVCCHYIEEDRVDVWVMKEHGVQESWTKLFSAAGYESMRTLTNSNCENEVILEGSICQLFRYDLKKKKKRLAVLEAPGCGWLNMLEADIFGGSIFDTQVFVESLVKPMTMAPGDGRIIRKPVKAARNNGNPSKRDGFLSKGFKLVL